MTSPIRQSPIARRPGTAGLGCLCLFFALFLIGGTAAFYAITVRPLLQVVAAAKWVETPCVIDFSGVGSHPSNNGHASTYSVEVAYHYAFQGSDYTSRRYQFDTGSSSAGLAAKQRIVNQYPPGRKTVCYVNPQAPAEAVLDRGAHAGMAAGAFFLIFAAIGGLGLGFAPRLARSQRTALSKNVMPVVAAATGEPIELKPQITPGAQFIGMLAFALIWNAFISIFVYLIFFSSQRQSVPLFVKLFIGCFVLLGILIFSIAIRRFLALFNPRLVLTTRLAAVPLGGEFRFEWNVRGRAEKLHKLRIRLEGQERATFHGGKTLQTVTQVFAEIPVIETIDRDILAEGQAKVVVPAGLMHTFTGGYNRIVWRLRVRAEVPHWPALEEDYTINILPQPPTA